VIATLTHTPSYACVVRTKCRDHVYEIAWQKDSGLYMPRPCEAFSHNQQGTRLFGVTQGTQNMLIIAAPSRTDLTALPHS